jgi:uncharacterized membrane protein YeaQ/YmgE (transglycosylase-associated protein family)
MIPAGRKVSYLPPITQYRRAVSRSCEEYRSGICFYNTEPYVPTLEFHNLMAAFDVSAVIACLVIGAIVGWVASVLSQSNSSVISDLVVGAIGAIVGGFLFSSFNLRDVSGLTLWTLVMAFAGSLALLALMRKFTKVDILA